ncbi:MAG: hypothetical protein WC951_11185 [Bacteroidales bacterium]|nr:hypothetical protein [Tenuifilaceae bacterium]
MEVELKKSTNNKIILPWLGTTAVTVAILIAFHLAIYYLFYTTDKTLAQHFINAIPIYFYAFIWPFAIVNSYKTSILKVTHNGEVNPALVKDYFLQKRCTLIEENSGHFKLESQRFFDKLYPGSRYVEIDFTDTQITIAVPSHLRYSVHHGFKFSDTFIRK